MSPLGGRKVLPALCGVVFEAVFGFTAIVDLLLWNALQ
jgi:hypothetical protein